MFIWGVGGREALEGKDICIHRAGSYCCTAEINTTLYNNYPPIKILKCAYEYRGIKKRSGWLALDDWITDELYIFLALYQKILIYVILQRTHHFNA